MCVRERERERERERDREMDIKLARRRMDNTTQRESNKEDNAKGKKLKKYWYKMTANQTV